jgi:predicted acylesterase/phospholipase RssA
MKRILAIDGGGIRGLIPALVCEHMEDVTDSGILKMFDLIAGTSTGGILALGYAAGLEAKELVDLYKTHGKEIFGRPAKVTGWWRPKYSAKPLEAILREKFGERKLSEAHVEVMVTNYNLDLRRPMVWQRSRALDNKEANDCFMYEAARGTSAAPTYFAPASVGQWNFVDGGLWANNPSAAAFIEAKKLWPYEDKWLLVSLGTGDLSRPIRNATSWGKAQWAEPVIDCLFDGASKSTDYMMKQLLSGNNYYRFQPTLNEATEELDNADGDNIAELEKLARDLMDRDSDKLGIVIRRLTDPSDEVTATIDGPFEGQLIGPGECRVEGTISRYSGQPLYLINQQLDAFFPSTRVRPDASGEWDGSVSVGSIADEATISLVVASEQFEQYIKFYLAHADSLPLGMELDVPLQVLAQVKVSVESASPVSAGRIGL